MYPEVVMTVNNEEGIELLLRLCEDAGALW
jgi:hypothetical protein